MTDDKAYIKKQNGWLEGFESLCLRCGRCCGAEQDPCANLIKDDSGKYVCKNYDDRLGAQKTISGNAFTCVPIGEVIKKGMPNSSCGYISGNV